jgi:hypothetical protein
VFKLNSDFGNPDIPVLLPENSSSNENEFHFRRGKIGAESRDGVLEILSKKEPSKEKMGSLIQFSEARINTGALSEKSFEKKYGLRESSGARFIRTGIKEPLHDAMMNTGDFFVKALGQSYLDRLDMLKGDFSDKNNNYSRGIFPKVIRMPLSFIGIPTMGNTPSLLLGNTRVGKKINEYRKRRRDRIDRSKQFIMSPFRRSVTNISHQLPLHTYRYGMTQRVRGAREWLDTKQQGIEAFISGGISGVMARRKQKKEFAQRQNKNMPKVVSVNFARDTNSGPRMVA